MNLYFLLIIGKHKDIRCYYKTLDPPTVNTLYGDMISRELTGQ